MPQTKHISDEDYDESVTHLASSKIDIEFDNKGVPHAVVVVKNLFDTAENSIRMFSEKLNSEVADQPDFIRALGTYLSSGKVFKLLLEDMPTEENRSQSLKMIIKASEQRNSNVTVKKLSTDSLLRLGREFTNNQKQAYHFIVSDDRAFRIETDADKFKATCNFNEPETAQAFSRLFDKYFNEA